MEYKLGWINFIGDIYLFIVFICCFGLALIFHFLFKIKVNLIVLSGLFIGVGIQLLVLFSNFKNFLLIREKMKDSEKFELSGYVFRYEETHRSSTGENIREYFIVEDMKFETWIEYGCFHIPKEKREIFKHNNCFVKINYFNYNGKPLIYELSASIKQN